MKRSFKFGLLLVLAAFTAFINPLKAQDVKKELDAFTKKFEVAYNKEDDKALKTMFTTDAVRTDAAGVVTTGDDNIIAAMAAARANTKQTLTIKPEKAEKQTDGTTLTSGTYHVAGTTNAGEKIDFTGSYSNTVVKEKGMWKISKMVLGNL